MNMIRIINMTNMINISNKSDENCDNNKIDGNEKKVETGEPE